MRTRAMVAAAVIALLGACNDGGLEVLPNEPEADRPRAYETGSATVTIDGRDYPMTLAFTKPSKNSLTLTYRGTGEGGMTLLVPRETGTFRTKLDKAALTIVASTKRVGISTDGECTIEVTSVAKLEGTIECNALEFAKKRSEVGGTFNAV